MFSKIIMMHSVATGSARYCYITFRCTIIKRIEFDVLVDICCWYSPCDFLTRYLRNTFIRISFYHLPVCKIISSIPFDDSDIIVLGFNWTFCFFYTYCPVKNADMHYIHTYLLLNNKQIHTRVFGQTAIFIDILF